MLKPEAIEYNLEKLSTEVLRLPSHFTRAKLLTDASNPYTQCLLASMIAYIATRKLDEKVLTLFPPRQSFWDYVLFRKPKAYNVKISTTEILKDIPEVPKSYNVIRICDIEEIPVSIQNISKAN